MKQTAFIAIVGRPNVGKSTLLNAIIGEKVAIVSKKPQTTRNRITGIYTVADDQFVFFDTPGLHNPRTKLGDFMVKTTAQTLGGVDRAILVVEAREEVGDIESQLIARFKADGMRAILVINKTDMVRAANIAKTIQAYSEAFDFDAVVPVSAKTGKGVDIVTCTTTYSRAGSGYNIKRYEKEILPCELQDPNLFCAEVIVILPYFNPIILE